MTSNPPTSDQSGSGSTPGKSTLSLPSLPTRLRETGTALTVGVFDGVHLGHQELLNRTRVVAARHGLAAVVMTFRQHPLSVLAPPYAPKPILSLPRKRQLLEASGVHMVLEVSFDLEFAGLSPEDFVSTVLKDRFAVRHLVCGTDFRFGRSGAGDIAFLRQASKSPPGFTLEIVDDIVHDSIVVRSTAVREAITIGDVGRAAEFLTRPHEIPGTVTRGLARGREIGFPTANLQPHGDLVMPLRGVYLTAVRVRDGQPNSPIFSAMTNIGFNPTFGLERLSIETHILGFDGDLVGQELEVFFLARLRDEQKFSGVEALRDQLNRDRAHCEALLATEPIRSLIGRIPPPLPPQS